MTRGRRIYLVLAAITILTKGVGLVLGRFIHGVGSDSFLSIVLIVSVFFLWRGEVWLQKLVGVVFLLSGAWRIYEFGLWIFDYLSINVTSCFGGFLGLVNVLAGLAVLFLPSLNAFFLHQRESGEAVDLSLALHQTSIGAACLWGIALGSTSGFLLACQWLHGMEFEWLLIGMFLLIGVGGGGAMGVVAGVAVGTARPDSRPLKRQVLSRGLRAAMFCEIAAVVMGSLYGGLFEKPTAMLYIQPGLPSALFGGLLWGLIGGPALAVVTFVLAVAVSLLVDGEGVRD